MKKEKNLSLVISIILAFVIAISSALIINIIIYTVVNKNKLATQVENHIGYFDEDISDVDNFNNTKKPNKNKDKSNIDKIETNKKFLEASINTKKHIKQSKKVDKKTTKQSLKLTSLQKEIKSRKELNDGEWLPPIQD